MQSLSIWCLFKQMVHLPLHLSAIRCNYLSQQGQFQRIKSTLRCCSGRDCFQHNIIFLVCSLLIRTVCTSSCSQYALLIQVVTTWLVCMLFCFCLHYTEILLFIIFLTQQKTCQLMSKFELSNLGFHKKKYHCSDSLTKQHKHCWFTSAPIKKPVPALLTSD